MMTATVKTDDWDKLWDGMGEITTENPAQKYRQNLILDQLSIWIRNISGPVTIADFGCGHGDLLSRIAKRFPHIQLLGFEYSEMGRKLTLQKVPDAKLFPINLEEIHPSTPEWLGKIDIGICSEVLEHLDYDDKAIQQIAPYLKADGKMIITVPAGLMNTYEKFIGHRRHYSVSRLQSLLTPTFPRAKVYGAGFPFFNLYKLASFIQGEKLVDSVHDHAKKGNPIVETVLNIFDWLFMFNLRSTPWGWQMFAIVDKRSSS